MSRGFEAAKKGCDDRIIVILNLDKDKNGGVKVAILRAEAPDGGSGQEVDHADYFCRLLVADD